MLQTSEEDSPVWASFAPSTSLGLSSPLGFITNCTLLVEKLQMVVGALQL